MPVQRTVCVRVMHAAQDSKPPAPALCAWMGHVAVPGSLLRRQFIVLCKYVGLRLSG